MKTSRISSILYKVIYKIKRLLWLFFHPYLWKMDAQINGIPVIQIPDKLVIGKHVSINERVFIQAKGGVSIGNNVTLSYGTTILTEGLDTMHYQVECKNQHRKNVYNSVRIGDGTWIAANVIILPGASVAKGCIVAAGSVVKGNLDKDNALYGGVPATFIRDLV